MHIHTYVCVGIYIYAHICMYICMYIYIYIYIGKSVYVHEYTTKCDGQQYMRTYDIHYCTIMYSAQSYKITQSERL